MVATTEEGGLLMALPWQNPKQCPTGYDPVTKKCKPATNQRNDIPEPPPPPPEESRRYVSTQTRKLKRDSS